MEKTTEHNTMVKEPFTLYIILTDGSRPLDDIAKDLGTAGLMHVAVLEHVDCITGKANPDSVPAMLMVPGVTNVEPDMPVEIQDKE